MPSWLTRTRVLSVAALFLVATAVSLPLLAQQRPSTVSLDLNGTWKDSRGHDVQITQTGTSVSIRFASGAVFAGELHGKQVEVKHSLDFDETNKSLPTSVREQITGEEVRIVGTVSDDGSKIEGTYYDKDPDWEHDPDTDTYKVKGFKPGDRPMSFFRGDLHIASVNVDYAEWYSCQYDIKRRLQSAKDDLERARTATAQRTKELEDATAACAAPEAELARLTRERDDAQNLAAATQPPEAKKSKAYKDAEARLSRAVARENQLFDRITHAQEYSSNMPPAAMQRMLDEYDQLEVQEKQLRAKLKQMQDDMGFTKQVKDAAERALAYDNLYWDQYKTYLHNFLDPREMATKRKLWAEETEKKAQDEMDAAQQAFDRLNEASSPLVTDINGSSEGSARYQAEVWSPDVMEKLKKEIEDARTEVGKANELRADARSDFLSAGQRNIAALEMWERDIKRSATAQKAIEWGFTAWDLGEKFAEKGWIGLLAEAAKKKVEQEFSEQIAAKTKGTMFESVGKVLGPTDFVEPITWKDYATDWHPTDPKTYKLVGSRTFKTATTGPAANAIVAKYLEAKAGRVLAEGEQAFFTSTKGTIYDYYKILQQREALAEAQKKLRESLPRGLFKDWGKGMRENFKKMLWDPKKTGPIKSSLGRDVVKKALKQLAANLFEGGDAEYAAQTELELSAASIIFLQSSRNYWHARDYWEFKSAERAEILEQYDEKNNLKVKTNTSFRTGTELIIELQTLDKKAASHEMQVTIGGRRASPVGPSRFSVKTDNMQKDATGGVKLEIKVSR
jgi:hypothetical protein